MVPLMNYVRGDVTNSVGVIHTERYTTHSVPRVKNRRSDGDEASLQQEGTEMLRCNKGFVAA